MKSSTKLQSCSVKTPTIIMYPISTFSTKSIVAYPVVNSILELEVSRDYQQLANSELNKFYQERVSLLEILFDQWDAFDIPYTDEQKLYQKIAKLDSESICVEVGKFKDTETTLRT